MQIFILSSDTQNMSKMVAEYAGIVGGLLIQIQSIYCQRKVISRQFIAKFLPAEINATAFDFDWKTSEYMKFNGLIATNHHKIFGIGLT